MTEKVKCPDAAMVGGVLARCRSKDCEYCRDLWRRRWVGRLSAEAYTATAVRFVTLTYEDARDGANLPREHVNRYCQWRRKKYDFRHLTVGEFGEKTGRPHWHSLQFYTGDRLPDETLDFSERNPHWKWGNSQYEKPRVINAAALYVFDYLNKGGFMLRPSPGIGKRYLMRYALLMARERRRLTHPTGGVRYTVPGVVQKNGSLLSFSLESASHYASEMASIYSNEWFNLWDELPADPLRGIDYG